MSKQRAVLVRVLYGTPTFINSNGYNYVLIAEGNTDRFWIAGPAPEYVFGKLNLVWDHGVRRGDLIIIEHIKKNTWRLVNEEGEV